MPDGWKLNRPPLSLSQTGRALRALERRDPPLVRREVDEGEGIQFWQTTFAVEEALDDEG